MITSLKWIKKYVPDLDVSPREYADRMTLSGSKVEKYRRLNEDLEGIVIGQVISLKKHPDADRLLICQVDTGDSVQQIVTGASNVTVGAKAPVVTDGGRVAGGHDGSPMPGGIRIKKGKLRGVESAGMLCSIEELGSTRDYYPDAPKDGIYILPDDAPVGEDVCAYLGLEDVIAEYEITSNRTDCFSVIGIAREAAATFGLSFDAPHITKTGSGADVRDIVDVSVEDADLCPRYISRAVRDVKIAPSPRWMRQALASHGIRPINNIVDVTNYVMEEYGQPMHAFDLDSISGSRIRVKRAECGETFVTLDGQKRVLDESMLMICDGERSVGIAGIMGGENSMISENVTSVLLEAACFDGTNIRLTSRKLGLRTDSSAKFEKGLDPNIAIEAINRACQLIEEIGAGKVMRGAVDVYQKKTRGRSLPFDAEKINAFLGTDIDTDTMLSYFPPLGIEFDKKSASLLIPSWRQDIVCAADIAEEVARFYGYDRIPAALYRGDTGVGGLSKKLEVEEMMRVVAQACGFSQGMTYSFESPKVFDRLLLPKDHPWRRAIRIQNPMGEDYSIMRTSTVGGMLASLSINYKRRNKDVRLFQFANIYIPKELPLCELPDERMQLTLGFYGGRDDFFTMKGALEAILRELGIRKRAAYDADSKLPFLHPGRQAAVSCADERIGYMGEVHPLVCEDYGIGDRAYIAVVDVPKIYSLISTEHIYREIPRHPSVSRDLSLVVPRDFPAGEIEKIFRKRAGKLLESCQLFDIYEGEQLRSGYKSLAYTLIFRAADHTLEEKEVTAVMKKVIGGLESACIELRQ